MLWGLFAHKFTKALRTILNEYYKYVSELCTVLAIGC